MYALPNYKNYFKKKNHKIFFHVKQAETLAHRMVLRWSRGKLKWLRLRQTVGVLLCFYSLYLLTANGATRHIFPPNIIYTSVLLGQS